MLQSAHHVADRKPLDPQVTATIPWASWNGIISLAWRHDDLQQSPEELAALIERAADLISRGLQLQYHS